MKAAIKISLCLSLAIWMLLGSACNIYQERKVADKTYLQERTKVMSSSRPDQSDEYTVYAALVDIDAGDHVKTLACFADGTTSLYLSTGGSVTALQKEHADIATATQALLKGAGERLDATLWVAQTDLALPGRGKDMVYLATDKGIYTLTLIPAYITEATPEAQEIHRLYTALYDLIAQQCELPSPSPASD